MPTTDEDFLTRREADILVAQSAVRAASAEDVNKLHWKAHDDDHRQLAENLKVAMSAIERERALHVTAHDAAHAAHNREHTLDAKAASHQQDAHNKEHSLEATQRDKAEVAIDKRLEGMNEVRSQLKDQTATFARVEVVNALTDRIIAIEKLDIKGEGRAIGQGAVVAIIVGAVSLVGTILGILIIVANFATKAV